MKTLFKNGLIYDGKGNPPLIGDILVEKDRITLVSPAIEAEAERVIDCTGLSISPGFIDGHSHNDFFYDYPEPARFYEPFIRQGITTQVTGNCGMSVFGVDKNSPHKEAIGGGLFTPKNPGSYQEFCKDAQDKLFVNIAPIIGYGTVRAGIAGLRATHLNQQEIGQMRETVGNAMENGAFGGSFGFMYEPDIYGGNEELLAFAEEVAQGDGILTVHPRAESKVSMDYPMVGRSAIERAMDEVVDIMKKTGVRTEYSHMIFVGKATWKYCTPLLETIHQMHKEGYDLNYDIYSMTYGESVITVVLPPWYLALSAEKRKTPVNMIKLKLMVGITKKILDIDYGDMTICYAGEQGAQYEGKTISQIAKEAGLSNFDAYMKIVDLSQGRARIQLDQYLSEEIIQRLMKDDYSIIMTDAWFEEKGMQNGAAYQTFPHFLVRAKEMGMPLEQIIHKMTGKTAERFRIKGRGTIESGNFADLTIFDTGNIKVKPDQPDFTPEGIKYVIVNGEMALENGQFHSVTAGKVLYRNKAN